MRQQTTVRTFVTFEGDFRDDSVWDANENLVVPGGRATAACIREQLQDRSFECSEITQHSFYGWRFDASARGERIACILQGGHPWLLISEPETSFLRRLMGRADRSSLEKLVLSIHDVLSHDTRFSSIRWFTRKDYEGGDKRRGTDAPTCPG